MNSFTKKLELSANPLNTMREVGQVETLIVTLDRLMSQYNLPISLIRPLNDLSIHDIVS